MQIKINKDGSFVSVAAAYEDPKKRLSAARAAYKQAGVDYRRVSQLGRLQEQLDSSRARIATLKAKSGTKTTAYANAVARRDALKEKMKEVKGLLSSPSLSNPKNMMAKLKKVKWQLQRAKMLFMASKLEKKSEKREAGIAVAKRKARAN